MADFDPQAYLQSNSGSSGFDPKAYLADKQPEIKRDYPVRRAISKYVVRPIVEGGAMTVGGTAGAILGSPAGPAGSAIAGAGLAASMYPPAHRAMNALDEALGIGGQQKPAGTIPEQLSDVRDEFTTGLGIEAGGGALRAGVRGIEPVLKGAIPTFLGPTKEAVAARIASNSAIKNAPSYLQQAERLPVILKNVGKAIDNLYDKASGFLRSSTDVNKGAVPVSKVNQTLSALQEGLKVGETTVGEADKAAANKIQKLISDISDIVPRPVPPKLLGPSGGEIVLKQKEAFLPEQTVRKLIQRIRKNIDFTDKSASSTNSVLTDVSGQLDAMLKAGNKDYAKAIRPVANLTRLQNDVVDKFGLTKRTGEGLAPTDATISSLKSLPSDRRGVSQNLAKKLKVVSGEDLTKASKNRQLNEQFVGGNAQGSRRTLGGATIGSAIGSGIGHMLGSPGVGGSIGTMVGGISGMATDTSGRQLAGQIIDAYVRAKPFLAKLPYEVVARLIASGALGELKQ